VLGVNDSVVIFFSFLFFSFRFHFHFFYPSLLPSESGRLPRLVLNRRNQIGWGCRLNLWAPFMHLLLVGIMSSTWTRRCVILVDIVALTSTYQQVIKCPLSPISGSP